MGGSVSGSRSTVMTNAASALRVEEVRRTRELLRLGWMIAAGVLFAMWLLPGDPRLRWALSAAIVATVAGSTWMTDRLRDPTRYDARHMTVLAIGCLVCGQLGILYVGAFSAAVLVVALGLYFFCRTEHRGSALAIYVLAAGGHAVLAIAIISGLVTEPGFYPTGTAVTTEAQIAGQVMMQLAYAVCFLLARVTRQTSLRAIDQLQRATRLASQRDVQVAELRRDLDRALEIGGPGRFTGQKAGRWELGNVIGRGSMGEVYEAGPGVAIKVLRRELLADARNVERFLREVKVASTIDSPHVVRVLGAATPDDPFPYLAMEHLEGLTLGEILHKDTVLEPALLAGMVAQICSALELARDAGIVHRDLKPHNLMRTPDGTWKILDFGIALLAHSATLTRDKIIGTPAYMAPEQAKGLLVDHRADIYALAAVLYRCLTGHVPFPASHTPAILYLVVNEMPERPRVSPALEYVLALGLAKSPDARFQSARELAEAVRAAFANELPDELERRARELVRASPWHAGATKAIAP
ncbi:MAG: serine/threonine-protein kinase [Kofleriaceae bacterium]